MAVDVVVSCLYALGSPVSYEGLAGHYPILSVWECFYCPSVVPFLKVITHLVLYLYCIPSLEYWEGSALTGYHLRWSNMPYCKNILPGVLDELPFV